MVPSTSEQRESLILFEIYYCKQNDTINITNFCRINIGYTNSEKNGKFISENEKYYFEPDINLPIEYFIEKGFYKLRFMIRKQRLGPAQSRDLMTDWIFVEFMDK